MVSKWSADPGDPSRGTEAALTDLIERVYAILTTEAEGDRAEPGTASAAAQRPTESTEKAVPILLAVSLAASAVLLFAVASGHLTGTVAGLGIAAALASVVAAVLVITRPSRDLFAVLSR